MLELASACVDRQVIKFCRLQDELVEWRNKRVESKSFLHLRTKMSLISKLCMMN